MHAIQLQPYDCLDHAPYDEPMSEMVSNEGSSPLGDSSLIKEAEKVIRPTMAPSWSALMHGVAGR